jgi:hypothetical protein
MKKHKEKTEKHCVVFHLIKIMNTKTEETQWMSLNGDPQIIKIVPPRDGLVLVTILPRVDSDSEFEECRKMFDRDFSDLYLKVVEP